MRYVLFISLTPVAKWRNITSIYDRRGGRTTRTTSNSCTQRQTNSCTCDTNMPWCHDDTTILCVRHQLQWLPLLQPTSVNTLNKFMIQYIGSHSPCQKSVPYIQLHSISHYNLPTKFLHSYVSLYVSIFDRSMANCRLRMEKCVVDLWEYDADRWHRPNVPLL